MPSGRLTHVAGVAIAALTVAALASAPPAVRTAAWAQSTCGDPAKAIGVSRVVEIDARSGPRFGLQQYPDHDFLRDGEIVLTFDDGPSRSHTRPVLDALNAHCTKATFFMVGRMALADPGTVQLVAQRGHTIGGHTWSHANLATVSAQRARDEIELGFSAIQQALGRPIAPFFRFPYLSAPKAAVDYVQSRGSGVFSIDVDSLDFRTRDPKIMMRTVLNTLDKRRKGILLFHDIQPSTARGLRTLLSELKARGYKVVHLVPKTSLDTIAAYDGRVSGDARRRQQYIAKNPLANRTPWDAKIATPPVGVIGTVPPGSTPPAVTSPTADAAKTAPRRDEPDWRKSVFGMH